MVTVYQVTIAGKRISVAAGSKADVARTLLDQGYTISQISKAVPMAYSQVHSIAKSHTSTPALREAYDSNILYHTGRKPRNPLPAVLDQPVKNVTPKASPITNRPTSKKRVEEAKQWAAARVDKHIEKLTTKKPYSKQPVMPSVSPLRPSKRDKNLGPCLNCGFDVIAKDLGGQRQMVHGGMDPKQYLSIVQFCHAFPKSLA